MEYIMKCKAFVLKERKPDGGYYFCHISFKPGTNEPEFNHDTRPNLLPHNMTMARYAANYNGVGSALFHETFDAWHELVDCELVFKDSTASQANIVQ